MKDLGSQYEAILDSEKTEAEKTEELYKYLLIGMSLENQWGSFRFNVYYLCGMAGTVLAGIITGYATNYYLNLSLFLAFALLLMATIVDASFIPLRCCIAPEIPQAI